MVEVHDDGQGLNFERIRQRVLELDWLSAAQLADISDARLAELIFEPGFSTASQVSELSGRGVGLDVVRLQLRSLKGTVTVRSSPKQGTTFTLKLPLTLTIANLLICLVGATALAFPADSIEEIVIPKTDQIKYSGTQRFLCWQEQIVPTYRLTDLLDYACPLPQSSDSKIYGSVPTPVSWAKPMLVMRFGLQVFALEVERLVTEQELVIKSFGEAIAPPTFTYGCTVLGDGSLVPVIDTAVLLETVVNQNFTKENIAINHSIPDLQSSKTPTILVVDDAVALRRTLALTLEKAGFRVLQAPDGREAIKQLQQSTIELVVCDVEMPNMNGFEFLSARRQDQSNIPIIMLTSRSNEKHRRLAMQLGASAYFTKPYIEQDFVKAIQDILSQSAKVISY
ncbi:MAG: response regulator [Coleofasciculaceae cyanobacterium]